jgi:hypothetical protein
MSLETMTKLASTTVGAGGSAYVAFFNIPQSYTDLKVFVSARETGATTSDSIYMAFNNDYTTSYTTRWIEGSGSSAYSANSSAGSGGFLTIGGSSSTANTFSNSEISVPSYTSSNYKSYLSDSVMENNATTSTARIITGIWSNTAAITQITLSPGTGSFAQYSTFTLYGVKNAAKTAGNSIKATGGNIVFDGTYVYHVFPSSGAFTPTQSLTADVLVVAGGGGGGHATGGQAGGGGAGGLLTFTSQSLGATSYTCTVGAGGAVASANNLPGSNGGNSQFGGLTACVGGGGAGSGNGPTGVSGGSGGGGASVDSGTSTPGTGTAGQGNNGGAGNGAPNYAAGGGGGAGAVGGSASGGNAGSGGIGATSALINGIGLATGVGQLSSGNYYFAGGGAGINGVSPTTTPTGGLGGGGASITAGTAYTGGGGGGRASGGSGIVIVRYKG